MVIKGSPRPVYSKSGQHYLSRQISIRLIKYISIDARLSELNLEPLNEVTKEGKRETMMRSKGPKQEPGKVDKNPTFLVRLVSSPFPPFSSDTVVFQSSLCSSPGVATTKNRDVHS